MYQLVHTGQNSNVSGLFKKTDFHFVFVRTKLDIVHTVINQRFQSQYSTTVPHQTINKITKQIQILLSLNHYTLTHYKIY